MTGNDLKNLAVKMGKKLPVLIRKEKWDDINMLTVVPFGLWEGKNAIAYEKHRRDVIERQDKVAAKDLPNALCGLVFQDCKFTESEKEKIRSAIQKFK